jgi:predicted membrane-bound mannosyltransferase
MDHFRSLGPSYPILILAVSGLMLIAMRTRNERFHAFFALLAVAALLIYPVTNFETVQRAPTIKVNR